MTDFDLLDGLDADARARRCVDLIEAERKQREGVWQYENACNHAIKS